MNVFLCHEIDELINLQVVFFGSCQLEDDFSLIISDIITIFSNNLLHLVGSNLAFGRKTFKILVKIPSLAVILDKGLFEFVQFEHVDILSFEFLGQVAYLLVEIVRIIQRLGCAL